MTYIVQFLLRSDLYGHYGVCVCAFVAIKKILPISSDLENSKTRTSLGISLRWK